MPDDVEIRVGKQHTWTLPRPFIEASEKYGGQTRLVKQSDGRYRLENYVAGYPFPNPSGPDKGTQIASTSLTGGRATWSGSRWSWVTPDRSIRRTTSATTTRR